MMKSLSIIAVILACAISFFLLLKDSQSEIGILNSLSMEKDENKIREESVEVTHSNEEQGEQPKDSKDTVKTEEQVAVKCRGYERSSDTLQQRTQNLL